MLVSWPRCRWIPFGSNQIVSLNDKLGSADRCQGGMFLGRYIQGETRLFTNTGDVKSPGIPIINVVFIVLLL